MHSLNAIIKELLHNYDLSHTLQLEAKLKKGIESDQDKLAEIDKELDRLKIERELSMKRSASAREEAEVVIKDIKKLEQEKQLLLEDIKRKERELGYFKGFYDQIILASQREKEDLQQSIQTKEKELQEANTKLEKKEEKLKKYKEKVHNLEKKIEEGDKELKMRDSKIIELERDKAKVVADLEIERMKVRLFAKILC